MVMKEASMGITSRKRDKMPDTWKKMKKFVYDYRYLHLMLLPVIAYFIIFKYLPMYGIIIAFTRYQAVGGFWGIIKSQWIGFEHFQRFFTSIFFPRLLRNSLLINLYRLIFAFPAPIFLAILINEINNRRFKRVVQTITYMPHFLSWVVVAGLLIVLLSPTLGPAAALLRPGSAQPVSLLSDIRYFRSILIISDIWKSVGWGAIIFLAAITGLDFEVYEAAMVDGANRIQRILFITLPQMGFIISIMLILNMGRILTENFEQIFNLYNPAVYEVSDVFETYVYRTGIVGGQYSQAAAVGLFQSVISLFMIVISNNIAHRLGYEGLW